MHTYGEKYGMHHIQKRNTSQEATEQLSHGLFEDLSTDATAKYQKLSFRQKGFSSAVIRDEEEK